ncbi:MAG: hypothetical protein K8T25_19540, partial [Planctomycetia bacterium]|nr:hypothetical protein [Planctomycetia bacterium]
PAFYLRFEISNPNVVSEFLDFLVDQLNQPGRTELLLGNCGLTRVSIVKDGECRNNFYFRMMSEYETMRYTLNIDELGEYIGAISAAKKSIGRTK